MLTELVHKLQICPTNIGLFDSAACLITEVTYSVIVAGVKPVFGL